VRHCPVCDAYEVRGQKIAIIGYGKCSVREMMFLRRYTDDLTLLTLGRELDLSPSEAAVLQSSGIHVVEEPVEEIGIEGDRIIAWRMAGGTALQFDTLYTALGLRARSRLASDLGAAMDSDGLLRVDEHQRTSVPGLYAVGDVVRGLNQISVAMGQAAIAAADINNSLDAPQG
jgi:thioredoxin reductase (NADPH)